MADLLCVAFCWSLMSSSAALGTLKRKEVRTTSENQGKISSQRTGAASCRQFGTMRWEPYYSKPPINVNNVAPLISWPPQSFFIKERTVFREDFASGTTQSFQRARLHRQVREVIFRPLPLLGSTHIFCILLGP